MGMQHFSSKNGGNSVPAGARFRADLGRKIGSDTRFFVVGGLPQKYRSCLCFVEVYRIEWEGSAPSLAASRCIRRNAQNLGRILLRGESGVGGGLIAAIALSMGDEGSQRDLLDFFEEARPGTENV